MREDSFIKFLTLDEHIESKDKAVRSRVSKARKVEKEFNIDLDTVVKDDKLTYEILQRIRVNMNDKSGAIQNSIRKYYLFVNGEKFPSLLHYEKSSMGQSN